MKRAASPSFQAVSSPRKRSLAKGNRGHGPALIWFRNDLRTHDNPALSAASEFSGSEGGLLALFLVDLPAWRQHDLSPAKIDLIMRTLPVLRKTLLDEYSVPLEVIVMHDDTADHVALIEKICGERGIKSAFWNVEYEVDEKTRDARVTNRLSELGIPCCAFHDQCIVRPGTLATKTSNKPFTVFTPFKNAWVNSMDENPVEMAPPPIRQRPLTHAVNDIPSTADLISDAIPKNLEADWPAGEEAAMKRLAEFDIERYCDNRNFPALDKTSRLSAYLSIGSISARACLQHALSKNQGHYNRGSEGVVTWINELGWRDFYRHILYSFPHVCKHRPFKEATTRVPWRYMDESDAAGRADFEAWCGGRTGYPLVDAAMRCLAATGWMHNRLRMLTAMFLSKHLLVWWLRGEAWFMRHLVDGDLASNNGGWQWSASTGTDAQPYFRIFNPVTQSERFDPDGVFIREWIPELKGLRGSEIHMPFERLDEEKFNRLKYPKPVVEHKAARERCLAAFKSIN